jgi:hypothetical protein
MGGGRRDVMHHGSASGSVDPLDLMIVCVEASSVVRYSMGNGRHIVWCLIGTKSHYTLVS